MKNADIVSAFCSAWKGRDLDKLMDFFADDAVYHNIPIDPPNVGRESIRATIESFTSAPESIDFVVHHQAENADGLVMNERTDYFTFGDTTVALRVMGVFELSDGKITHWRDYFDMQQYLSQLPGQ